MDNNKSILSPASLSGTTTPATQASTASAPAQQPKGKTDVEIMNEISASTQGNFFQALMNGTAEICKDVMGAIMTLLCVIAYFTEDLEQIDRIFRQGVLIPAWWDNKAKKGGATSEYTYAQYYIRRALATFRITVPTIHGLRRITDLYPDINPIYSQDDVGNALLFSSLFRFSCLFCIDNAHWYIYDGKRWVMDDGGATENCKIFTVALAEYARRCAAIDWECFPTKKLMGCDEYIKRDAYAKHTERSKSRRVRETILKDASTDIRMAISLEKFDCNPYLLNCLNGTLDLQNWAFRPHSPADFITKMANVEYRPGLRSPLWEQHIATVMDSDMEKAQFLQKSMGYALTGSNKYACFVIIYGPRSRNGKSATVDTFNKMMGDYGASANPETFAQKFSANGSAHSDDLARLAGIRFLSVPESEQTMTLSASLIKRCTGDGEITARAIYGKQFSYSPQYKIFIHTNHLPRINDLSMFDSNRVKVIPFTHYFEEKDRNPNMVAELTTPENMSAILNWALEGWKLLESTGFNPPHSVLAATEEYHQESDRIGNFLDECMVQSANSVASTREVYERYKIWCDASGLRCGREQDFKKALNLRGIDVGRPRVNGTQVTAYLGWQLRPLPYGPGPSVSPSPEA